MVSKLALASFEVVNQAIVEGEDQAITVQLRKHYYEIVDGIGAHKSPVDYGAFPSDPYSHTPGGKGAQQPGMTGQVKEDILSRFGELGVRIQQGEIHFDPALLNENEFLNKDKTFFYYNLIGERKELELSKDSLVFTYCQVPVVYKKAAKSKLTISFTGGQQKTLEGQGLDKETTISF